MDNDTLEQVDAGVQLQNEPISTVGFDENDGFDGEMGGFEESAEVVGGDEAASIDEGIGSQEPRTFTQEELDKTVKDRLKRESKRRSREAEMLAARLESLERLISQANKPQSEEWEPDTSVKGQVMEALSELHKRQSEGAMMQKRQAEIMELDSTRREMQKDLEDLEDSDPEVYERLSSDDYPITEAMANTLMYMPNRREMLKYLGENFETANKISQLSPANATKEMAKLSFEMAKNGGVKRVSNAPAPMQKAKGSPAAVISQENLSVEQMAEMARNKNREMHKAKWSR